jgi:hypothetical protein
MLDHKLIGDPDLMGKDQRLAGEGRVGLVEKLHRLHEITNARKQRPEDRHLQSNL